MPPSVRIDGWTNRRIDGFTLIEILLAMFVLALGMIAIASVFPVAGYLQKQYYNKSISEDIETTLQVTVRRADPEPEKFFSNDLEYAYTNVVPPPTPPTSVFQLLPELIDVDPTTVPDGTLDDEIQWPLSMRCSPQVRDIYSPNTPPLDPIYVPNGIPNEPEDATEPNPDLWADDDEDPYFFRREFYWIPLAQDTNGGVGGRNWKIHIVVVRASPDANYDYSGSGYPNNNNWRRRSTSPVVIFANRNDGRENPLDDGTPANNNTIWHVPGVRRFALHNNLNQRVTNPLGGSFPSSSTRLRINQAGVGTGGNQLRMGEILQPGDWVLGGNGVAYRVVDVDNPDVRYIDIDQALASSAQLTALRTELTAIWIALPAVPGQSSPAVKIFTIEP